MTKQQFLDGNRFTIGGNRRKGDATFYFTSSTPKPKPQGSICKEVRSGIDDRALTDDYHLNVIEIGNKSFKGFTMVMGKEVKVKYKFTDLMLWVYEGVD